MLPTPTRLFSTPDCGEAHGGAFRSVLALRCRLTMRSGFVSNRCADKALRAGPVASVRRQAWGSKFPLRRNAAIPVTLVFPQQSPAHLMLVVRTFQQVLVGNTAFEEVARTAHLAGRKPWLPDPLDRNLLVAANLAACGFVLRRTGRKRCRIGAAGWPISPCRKGCVFEHGFIGPVLEYAGPAIRTCSVCKHPGISESDRALERVANQSLDPYPLREPGGIHLVRKIGVFQSQ